MPRTRHSNGDSSSAASPSANTSPIKVSLETKQMVRFGAGFFRTSQQEFVALAVREKLQKDAAAALHLYERIDTPGRVD